MKLTRTDVRTVKVKVVLSPVAKAVARATKFGLTVEAVTRKTVVTSLLCTEVVDVAAEDAHLFIVGF